MGTLGKSQLNPTLVGMSIAVQTGHPTMVVGQPGIGKTEIWRYFCIRSGRFLIDMIGSNREPTDYLGFPVLLEMVNPVTGEKEKALVFAPPKWALDLVNHGDRSAWLNDETTQMAPASQNAYMRAAHDREVGDLKLPAGMWTISAMNPPETTQGTFPLNSTAANRFIHFRIPAGTAEATNEYLDWEEAGQYPDLSEVVLDPSWSSPVMLTSAKEALIGFLRDNPDLLDKQPNLDDPNSSGPWPSRRSVFTFARDMLAALQCSYFRQDAEIPWDRRPKMPDSVWRECIAGCVGADFSNKFFEWTKSANVPSGEKLLKKPDLLKRLTSEPDVQEALRRVQVAMAGTAPNKATLARWEDFWAVVNTACDMGYAQHAAQHARTAFVLVPWTSVEGGVRRALHPLSNVRADLAENLKALGIVVPQAVITQAPQPEGV